MELKSIPKTLGKGVMKAGGFVGKNIAKGAVHLYNNKDEYLEKAGDAMDKKRTELEKKAEKNQKEKERFKNNYKTFSQEELISIVKNEKKSNIERKAAQEVLREKY